MYIIFNYFQGKVVFEDNCAIFIYVFLTINIIIYISFATNKYLCVQITTQKASFKYTQGISP